MLKDPGVDGDLLQVVVLFGRVDGGGEISLERVHPFDDSGGDLGEAVHSFFPSLRFVGSTYLG